MRIAISLALAAAALTPFAPAPIAQAQAQQVAPDESARLHAWFEAKNEEMLQFSPLTLTQLGRKERYGELDDMSDEAQDAQLAWHLATVQELEREFDYETLSPQDRLSYDLWKYEYESAAEAAKWRGNTFVLSQMQGIHTALPSLMIATHGVDTLQDMKDYIARVSQFERALTQVTDRAAANAARGVRPPYFAYDFVIAESSKLIEGAPFTEGPDTALWEDGKTKIAALVEAGTIDAATGETLKGDLETALQTSYLPGYQRVIAFMERDRANAPAKATGVGGLPDGAEYYASRLRLNTTTDLTAEQVHQIGLDDIRRLRGEMEAIREQVGFEGDLQAFFEHVRTGDFNYFPQGDEGAKAYIDAATAAIETIEGQLPAYFGLLPKAGLEVRRVEAFREQDGGAQHYRPGTPDGSRPGIYYAHLSDMRAMPKNMLEVIAYHEGLPGHHMQISIARELTGVPTFQTQVGYTAFAEGWGLYSERLAKEMPGTYEDPYSDFGRLTSEMWRAVRLVVDTGLHAKGWTEDEAVAFFAENAPLSPETIRNEVRRYIVIPGQATAYKIGMNKILDLRTEAERELGPRFDVRAFHDTVLGSGSLPLPLLETRVRDWIASSRAG